MIVGVWTIPITNIIVFRKAMRKMCVHKEERDSVNKTVGMFNREEFGGADLIRRGIISRMVCLPPVKIKISLVRSSCLNICARDIIYPMLFDCKVSACLTLHNPWTLAKARDGSGWCGPAWEIYNLYYLAALLLFARGTITRPMHSVTFASMLTGLRTYSLISRIYYRLCDDRRDRHSHLLSMLETLSRSISRLFPNNSISSVLNEGEQITRREGLLPWSCLWLSTQHCRAATNTVQILLQLSLRLMVDRPSHEELDQI